ncbi:proline hydroxylase [Nocardiopsis sp. LOL_012]|uniref:2OG-Fe(II)-dependent halogenase WelO5 family protein n=1 Tax=Nocardiopsis sp. LOL_012 TaxID=3345409 RepID=UPI003A898557
MEILENDAIDPFFVASEVSVATRGDIASLIAGTSAAVRIPSLLPKDVCSMTMEAMESLQLEMYDRERVDPPIARFGPVLNDYRHNGQLKEEYWEHADRARSIWRSADFTPDPLKMCREMISNSWGEGVQPAKRQGRDLFVGTVREINSGAHMHYDEIVREYPSGVVDSTIVAQLAFNAYISVPDRGGDTVVWRRRWQPSDVRQRRGYGYEESLAGNVQHVTIKPCVGDGLIFDPRNYHAVRACEGGRRVAIAFFLGFTDQGKLLLWS